MSAVSVRSSNLDFARQEARANARLALMIAMGELQRAMGPDRRVSAAAGVLDEQPGTSSVAGVYNPHWMLVWPTEMADGDPQFTRDDMAGGLKDRRFQGRGYDRERSYTDCLVSGNEGGRAARQAAGDFQDPKTANLQGRDAVPMVDAGSVDRDDQEVVVKRVPTKTVRNSTRENGGYGYWVGSLNARANVGVVDAHHGTPPSTAPYGVARIANAQDVGEEVIPGIDEIPQDEALRLFTTGTLSLLDSVGNDALSENFHALTAYSRSVLANVRDGGLQRDMTAYVEGPSQRIQNLTASGVVVSRGIDSGDRLVGPPNETVASELGLNWNELRYEEICPRFGLLWNYYNAVGRNVDWGDNRQEMIPPALMRQREILEGMSNIVNVYDGINWRPASFKPHDRTNLSPIMVEGSMYYNLAVYPQITNNSTKYILRLCMYPRIAVWNPYNIEMNLGETMALMFLNGNKRVALQMADGSIVERDIPFGRGSPGHSGATNRRHYRGMVIYSLPETVMAPGETLVFSPPGAAAYDLHMLSNNKLSASATPDGSKYYYQDYLRQYPNPNGGIITNGDAQTWELDSFPRAFWEQPEGGNRSGADNYCMALKHARRSQVDDDDFNQLQLMCYINPSLQAGGGDELPVLWDSNNPVPVHRLRGTGGAIRGAAIPDKRTRDGFRLRWWKEHQSNRNGSGRLAGTPEHLQSSLIGTWNPRAAYFCRSPWENVADVPPYFYGAYTRDLFGDEVSFTGLAPRAVGGKQLGFPFGPPVEGPDGVVLFEVPRREIGIPSLGYFQHLKVSEFGWHPSYAIGNSLVDPRVGRVHTSPDLSGSTDQTQGGWNRNAYGWGNGNAPEYWASLTREILFNRMLDNNLVYDISFEANYNLWDDFFMSTGYETKDAFYDDPAANPLPNGRIGLFSRDGDAKEEVSDFHLAAKRLSLDGGFDVHSIEKEAWKAQLASIRDTGFGESSDRIPFPRLLNPSGQEVTGDDAKDPDIWDGYRSLSDEELDRLAEEIVIEVKKRAPFFGLSDFVNRRLVDDETGDKGPLQAAIDRAGINSALEREYPIENSNDLPSYGFLGILDATRLNQSLKPSTTAWGVLGHLTQGDVLQVAGSSLRARSDSFVIRSYGESVDASGNVAARAWCEAVVQRVPDPLNPDEFGLNPLETDADEIDFGREFRLVSFRWLSPEEV